jgi:N-carbamoyl-L-amino-acid hydrolase
VNHPNAINVIPDRVEFTIDFRAPLDETLDVGDRSIRQIVSSLCECWGLQFELEQTEAIAARPMDWSLIKPLQRAAGADRAGRRAAGGERRAAR